MSEYLETFVDKRISLDKIGHLIVPVVTIFIHGSYLLIRYGHIQVIRFLVEGQHCDCNAVDKYGMTSLHLAAQ